MGTETATVNEILWQIVLSFCFFGASTVFSASETALVSLSRPRLKKLISQRPELGEAFTAWLASPQYLLTTILIGSTLCNVVTTVLVTNVALALLPGIRTAWVETGVWLVLTIIMFVFADL